MAGILTRRFLDTSRGRIVALLRRAGLTVDDIASTLSLTASGVRVQMTAMERDGVVKRAGQRPGVTRPSHIFELTPEVEQLLSQAYIPFLAHLVRTVAEHLPAAQMDAHLRKVGKGLGLELSGGKRLAGSLGVRVAMASELLNEQLGALTHVEKNGHYVIRGVGCPLAALTGKQPGVCHAMESLVAEVVRAPVRECCERAGRPRCCFKIETQRKRRFDLKPFEQTLDRRIRSTKRADFAGTRIALKGLITDPLA